jgi:hypothetical protein
MSDENAASALLALSTPSSSFGSPPRRRLLQDITNRSPREQSPKLNLGESKERKRATAHYMYHELNMSLREIEELTSRSPERIPKSTAGDWIHRASFSDTPRSGRPSHLNVELIKKTYKETASLRITSNLLGIPRTTVHRAVKAMGLRRVKRKRIPVLSEVNKNKRMKFATYHLTHMTDFKQWGCSDEKIFTCDSIEGTRRAGT